MNQTMTRLLKSLVFHDFPQLNWRYQNKKIEDMYKILIKNPVNFKEQEYNGKEKKKLERVGREYLSIIRHHYGTTKPTNFRKHSTSFD